jgi:MFS family permease
MVLDTLGKISMEPIKKSLIIAKRYFYLYTFFSSFFIFLPMLVSIYKYRGIGISEILLLESIYNIVIALFEVPTGILADKIGHDKSVIFGVIGLAISFGIFAFSNKLIHIIVVQIMLGIFTSCISGSDIGNISKLESINSEKDGKLFYNLYAISTLSMLSSYVLSGVIIKADSTGLWVLLVEAIVTIISAGFYMLYYFSKKKTISLVVRCDKNRNEIRKEPNQISLVNGRLLEVCACGLLLGIISSGYLVSQFFLNNLEISSKYFGLIYCFIGISSIAFSRIISKMKSITVILMPILFVIPYFNYLFMILPFILLYAYLKARVIPFVQEYISSRTEEHKARNLSIGSMINNLINGIFMLGLSKLVNVFGFQCSMIIMALITSLLLMYVFRIRMLDKDVVEN